MARESRSVPKICVAQVRFAFSTASRNDYGLRVSLLAGRTTWNPNPHARALRTRGQQVGKCMRRKRLEGCRIAKEIGNADQQLIKQPVDLMRVFLKVTHVVLRLFDLVDNHPPFNASADGGFFVRSEVVPGTRPQECQNALQRLTRKTCLGAWRAMLRQIGPADVQNQLRPHGAGGKDIVGKPGGNRRSTACRHIWPKAALCTMAIPSSAFTARSPSVPSAPVPDRMMQMACSR